jgi:hypothetical protein
MNDDFIIAGQITTGHSELADLTPQKVTAAVNRINDVLPVEILCIGWREIPDLYHALTSESRVTKETFVWYPLLSDYPGLEASELVVNYKGKPAGGWVGFPEGDEVHETFQFGCPNNPQVREKTLHHLEYLLTTYAFDGVFLDKLRFPSPANSFDDMLSCFCPHCRARAQQRGLDLDAVRAGLGDPQQLRAGSPPGEWGGTGLRWLDDLLGELPLLQHFLGFRAESIAGLVREAYELARRLGRKMSLDMFSPGLAPLVAQDYSRLGEYAAWVKPMSYRFTQAPASLRLEVPTLVQGIADLLSISPAEVKRWAGEHVPGIGDTDPGRYKVEGTPQALFAAEVAAAVDKLAPVPVLLGLETVYWPGLTEPTAGDVFEMARAGREAGVAGACFSWDLLHSPLENIAALKKAL